MKIEALGRELPPATLLLGPDVPAMVGTAARVVRGHGAVLADTVIIVRLTAVDARSIVKFAGTAPFGPFKVVIAALDGASTQAQNILLKVLEEPPLLGSRETAVRFILVASSRPLPTIVSRCQVITVPAPNPIEGLVSGKAISQVAAALNAANAGDLRGLDTALTGWGEDQRVALDVMLAAAATGDHAYGLTRVQSRRLLGALGRFSGAHPRLAAHAALISVLSDKEKHD